MSLTSDRFARLDAHFTELIATGTVPHVQFRAARDGDIVHEFCRGDARADCTPLRPDAIYRIASMTKAITAVTLLMLVEVGWVALDDPIARYLPELADLAVHVEGTVPPFATRPPKRQPQVIDLLLHTAGFTYGQQQRHPVDPYYWTAGLYNFKAIVRREAMLERLASLPLVSDPGERYTYSVATDLVGIIVERVMDRPLGEIFAERIFAPLGMTDTGFQVPPDKLDRFTDAWAIHPRRGRYLYDAAEDSVWGRTPAFESGGGGLVSTLADYHRFCRMLLGEGILDGERLLKAQTVADMTRNHLPGGKSIGALSQSMYQGAANADIGHGLGVAVTLPGGNGAPPAGEFHWMGLFNTFYSIIPSEQLILILMTQIIPAGEDLLAPDVHRILFT